MRVKLIDSAGRVAAELPAQVEAYSMTVPEGAETRRSFMIGASPDGRRQIIWARCPNGQCIRIVVLDARDNGGDRRRKPGSGIGNILGGILGRP